MRLEFRQRAFEDLQYLVQMKPKVAKRLLRLIEETKRDPFGGTGKSSVAKKHGLHTHPYKTFDLAKSIRQVG